MHVCVLPQAAGLIAMHICMLAAGHCTNASITAALHTCCWQLVAAVKARHTAKVGELAKLTSELLRIECAED